MGLGKAIRNVRESSFSHLKIEPRKFISQGSMFRINLHFCDFSILN